MSCEIPSKDVLLIYNSPLITRYSNMEESLPQLFRAIAALVFVVALMGGLAILLKRLGFSGAVQVKTGKKRLKLIETLPLDARRKLAIVERDNVQHLILLGGNDETVIETGFKGVNNETDD